MADGLNEAATPHSHRFRAVTATLVGIAIVTRTRFATTLRADRGVGNV